MQVEITGKHLEITASMREHLIAQLDKLNQFFKDKQSASAHAVITVEKNRQIAEIMVTWREHVLKAQDSDKDLYQAINKAVDKIEKQARRMKEKVVSRKQHAKPTAEIAPEPDGAVDAAPLPPGPPPPPPPGAGPPAPLPPRIINVSTETLKPMTPEEAVLTLDGDNNQFVVFRDAETERVMVLYKRADGNFGLMQP